jgi:hypothetical protein
MHIFIDESGTFTQGQRADAVSLVGALIVPEVRLARIEERYAALRPDLPKEKDEVKGRLLNEAEVARLVAMLLRYEVLFEVTAIDLVVHRPDELVSHQVAQAERITRNLTEKHSRTTQEHVRALRKQLEQMARSCTRRPLPRFRQSKRFSSTRRCFMPNASRRNWVLSIGL